MPAMSPLYPHEAEYELMGNGLGEACAFFTTPTEEVIESAKFSALQQLRDADALMAVRYKVQISGAQKCVTLIGRGYRVKYIRAVMPKFPGHMGAAEKAPASELMPDAFPK